MSFERTEGVTFYIGRPANPFAPVVPYLKLAAAAGIGAVACLLLLAVAG